MSVSPPVPVASADARRLTRVLRESGFTFDAVKARLHAEYRQWAPEGEGMVAGFLAFLVRSRMRFDIGSRMLSPPSPGILGRVSEYFRHRQPKDRLGLLIRLFLFNEPVRTKALLGVFSADDFSALAAMNLIRLEADIAVSDLALFECGGLFFATDAKVKPPADVNRVMPLLPESFDFVGSVSRKPVSSALDLCTGSGVHAMMAARHSKQVVATDISPRALHFAKFNAWFNGISNVEFNQGDLFDASNGGTFDLILANPPYMPVTRSSPGDNFYCGGKNGDVLWSRILQGLEMCLRPGGLCQMIHMTVLFDHENFEHKVRALLGLLSDSCSIVVCSHPIAYRNQQIANASSVHFGVTCIKRHEQPGEVFYVNAPFHPPLPFDVADLFLALEQTSDLGERTHICKRYCARSTRST